MPPVTATAQGTGVEAEDAVSFGRLLRRLRLTAGLTQESLAERAQLSERAVRALEGGNGRRPRLQTVRLLATALGIDDPTQARMLNAARPEIAPAVGPPPRSAPAKLLPSLIGREEDAAIVKLLLEDRRLVTICGAGGAGKTRLALEVMGQSAANFDRCVFVELASLSHSAQVAPAIANALSVREMGGRSLLQRIAKALEGRRVLLVLDNMEHLLEARDLVLELLAPSSDLSILVTTREALHVRGERVYTLWPLALPSDEFDIARSPAVRLFLERSQDTGAPVAVDDASMSAVAEICERLDGLPLAIELAAAWTPLLTPRELVTRLSDPLKQLEHGAQDLPPRQRTMRNAIAWSYDLLTPAEQDIFARLGVFSGGCTVEAVDFVCGGAQGFGSALLDRLSSLRHKSLLTVQEPNTAGGAMSSRFGMLETVKEFAAAQLSQAPDASEAHERHAAYFLSFIQSAQHKLAGPEQTDWLKVLDVEHANFRAALRFARKSDDIELGLCLVGCLWPFWQAHNHFEEAKRWIDEFLPKAQSRDLSSPAYAYALQAAGSLANLQAGNESSIVRVREGLKIARKTGDEACVAALLHALGGDERNRGNYREAEALFEEGMAIYRRQGNNKGLCDVLMASAAVSRYQGDYRRAELLFREALDLSRQSGDLWAAAGILARLGNMATERGNPAESGPLYDDAAKLFLRIGDSYGIADVLYRRGETAANLEEFAEAIAFFDESLRLYVSLGATYGCAYALLHKGETLILMENLEDGKRCVQESLSLFKTIDDRRCVAFALMYLGDVARGEGGHREAFDLYKESLSLHRSVNTRPQMARCLERMACLAAIAGEGERAARLNGAALRLHADMGSIMTPAERVRYEPLMTRTRNSIGSDTFARMEAEGAEVNLNDVVEYALTRSAMYVPQHNSHC